MSRDQECVAFLRWLLPHLGLRWSGFRKVRRQVCRRLRLRAGHLGLDGLDAYRGLLERDFGERTRAADCCRVTISRFYRDRGVFDALRHTVLPALAQRTDSLRAWSAGCASGEEPHSLLLAWELDAGRAFPSTTLEIIASDADPHLLERARQAVYPAGCLRELPVGWLEHAFSSQGDDTFVLLDRFRHRITWHCTELPDGPLPDGPFDIVLCRNLAFTYFDTPRQRAALNAILARIVAGGALVVGCHETPPEHEDMVPWPETPSIYRKDPGHQRCEPRGR